MQSFIDLAARNDEYRNFQYVNTFMINLIVVPNILTREHYNRYTDSAIKKAGTVLSHYFENTLFFIQL